MCYEHGSGCMGEECQPEVGHHSWRAMCWVPRGATWLAHERKVTKNISWDNHRIRQSEVPSLCLNIC